MVIVFTGSTILNSFRIFEIFLMGELKGTPLTHLPCTGFKTQGKARNNDTDDKKKERKDDRFKGSVNCVSLR